MDDGHNHSLADKRLIEHGFPCHQVGAETVRERDTGKAPPVNRLHVWWARRPLTPSRAAIVASLAPWDTDPEQFVRQLGIERLQTLVNDQPWTLTGDLLGMVDQDAGSGEFLEVNAKVVKALQDEQDRRVENRQLIAQMQAKNPALAKDPVLQRWAAESQSLPTPFPDLGEWLPVRRVMGDPAWAKERIDWENAHKIRTAEDKYGYERAFKLAPCYPPSELTVLDPTAGGGSIPFEALRLGYKVIANELNPVATTILYATLDYPIRFGVDLANDIQFWGSQLRAGMVEQMGDLFPASRIPDSELAKLRSHLTKAPELIAQMAAAASSIFIACRKRPLESDFPASWTGLGGQGVQQRIREAVVDGLREFEPLRLNPVDEMVASYGRALHILSRNWPVMDGDEQVSPIRAMNEASRVVAENQIRRITHGRLKVDDLDPETTMALTLYGIYGLYELAYDEALNLSHSLNIRLDSKTGGYRIEPGQRFIGLNQEASGRSRHARAEDTGFAAPLIRKGSKLRLARPEERDKRRLEQPQTDWDRLQGLLMAYRRGDLPVARQYLATHAAESTPRVIDLLEVWTREMDDEKARQEAEALLFGLRS
jgi:adenine-specific DNA methylase